MAGSNTVRFISLAILTLMIGCGSTQPNVFWSGDPVRAALLKGQGVSASYRSPNAGGAAGTIHRF